MLAVEWFSIGFISTMFAWGASNKNGDGSAGVLHRGEVSLQSSPAVGVCLMRTFLSGSANSPICFQLKRANTSRVPSLQEIHAHTQVLVHVLRWEKDAHGALGTWSVCVQRQSACCLIHVYTAVSVCVCMWQAVYTLVRVCVHKTRREGSQCVCVCVLGVGVGGSDGRVNIPVSLLGPITL